MSINFLRSLFKYLLILLTVFWGGLSQLSVAAENNGKSMAVNVVTPVYRELKNGNLARMIESFLKQQNQNFDLVFVINNNPDIAKDKSSEILEENQDTLAVLHFVKGEVNSLPNYLSKSDREIFERARGASIKLDIVDLSTNGIFRNIGLIRDIGVQRVIQKARSMGQNEIVAMLDADCTVSPDYVEKLSQTYSGGDFRSVFLMLEHGVEKYSPRALYASTFKERFWFAWQSFVVSTRNLPYTGVGTPQITATTEALASIGGVPHLEKYEDFELAKNLWLNGQTKVLPDLRVKTNDRVRPDGWLSSKRLKNLELDQDRPLRAPYINFVRIILKKKLGDLLSQDRLTNKNLKMLFNFYGYRFNAKVWEKIFRDVPNENAVNAYFEVGSTSIDELAPETDLFRFFSKRFSNAQFNFRDLYQLAAKKHDLEASKLIIEIKNIIESVSRKDKKETENRSKSDFLDGNVWLIPEIQDQLSKGQTSEQILDNLKSQFPDWFLTFSQTPLKQRIVRLNLVRDFMYKARGNFLNATFSRFDEILKDSVPLPKNQCESLF